MKKKEKTAKGYHYRAIFQLSWAPSLEAKILMDHLKNKYGGSYSVCSRKAGFISKHTTTLKYSVESAGLYRFIKDIKPFLVLKKKRAEIIFKLLKIRQKSFTGRTKPERIWKKEDKIYLQMNNFNSKNKKNMTAKKDKGMKDIIIAFDVDGCILDNGGKKNAGAPVKKQVIELIKLLSNFNFFQNVYLICWSGNGKEYAEEVVKRVKLEGYFAGVHSKWEYDKEKYGEVDIAVDDLADFAGAHKNLILKQ